MNWRKKKNITYDKRVATYQEKTSRDIRRKETECDASRISESVT
jgi:hypothetical protein